MLLGNKIKELRDKHEVLQRQLAAYLEIDTPMFSKIERGDRRAKRSQVILLAKYFHIDEKDMLTLWLADKVLDALEGEDELKLTAIETAKDELWMLIANLSSVNTQYTQRRRFIAASSRMDSNLRDLSS